jgi:nucleoside-diphosphate-sugar epimerase
VIFIFGAAGFVGSAFVHYCQAGGLPYAAVTHETYRDWVGQPSDLFINAAGNSGKRLSMADPLRDFDRNVRDTLQSLLNFPAARYVYISSIDVYNDCAQPTHNAESASIQPARLSRYGLGKYLAEQLVRRYAAQSLIVRLGGMVGPGLRKNAVYDVTQLGRLFVDADSEYQYLHTAWVAESILQLGGRCPDGDIVNLCGDGTVRPRDVAAWSGRPLPASDGPLERYDVNISKLRTLVSVHSSESSVRRHLEELAAGPAT